MKKKTRSSYQFLLTLLAIISLVLFSEIFILKVSVLSTNHWIKTTTQSNYAQKLTATINRSIQDLGLGSGISAGGLKDVITEEQVTTDFDLFLENTLNATPYLVDQEAVKDSISLAIADYSKKENKPINKENKSSIDQFIDRSYQIYDQAIRNKFISIFGLRVHQIDQFILYALFGSFFLLIILLILIYTSCDGYRHVFFRNLSYLFSSSSLLIFFTSFLVYQYNPIKTLSIFDDNLNNWLFEGLKQPQIFNLIISLIFFIVGVGLSLFSYKEYIQLEQRNFRREKKQQRIW